MKKTIIVNNGSTSKKYAFYTGDEFNFFAHYEQTPEKLIVTENLRGIEKEQGISVDIFKNSFSDFVDKLLEYKLLDSEDDVTGVAVRIVAPGKVFQSSQIIDDDYLEKLDEVYHLSPLHLKPVKEELAYIKSRLPGVKIVAISDSEFHKSITGPAKIYALPKKITEKLGLYRYGYHGISVSASLREYTEKFSTPEKVVNEKIIICHLGGGSSITAIKDGKSFDTSMGFSPLEGLAMASRSGNVDPNALLAIMDSEDFDTKELQNFLYKECGMLGISGITADTRELLELDRSGHADAKLALDFYIYHIQKIIGSFSVVMGGLDTIVFTGTIGERSAEMRKRICEKLEILGIILDAGKNKMQLNGDGLINSADSKVKVVALSTEEIDEMAKIALKIV